MSKTFFIPIHDIVNDILYVDFNTYEFCKKNNLEIEGIPKIIHKKNGTDKKDMNCYTITRDQLKALENKTGNPINAIKVVLEEEKPKIPEEFKICITSDDKMFVNEIYKRYIEKAKRRKIRIMGNIYIQVDEEDIVNITREYRRRGMKLVRVFSRIEAIKKPEIPHPGYEIKDIDDKISSIKQK